MYSTLKVLLLSGFLFCCLPSFGQKQKEFSTNLLDPRFTVTAKYDYSSFSEWEEIFYYVQNHTNRELQLELEVTVNYTCDRTKTYLLGVNKVVYLPANGQFTPSSDWVHNEFTSNKKKECVIKGSDGILTTVRYFNFRLLSVRDLTTEKENKAKEEAEKKRLAEEAKSKRDNFNAQIKKADDAIAAKNYTAAEEALNEAQRILPDNTVVSSKRDRIKSLKEQELMAKKREEEAAAKAKEAEKQKAIAAAATQSNSATGSSGSSKAGTSTSSDSESGKSSMSATNSQSASAEEDAQQKREEYEESQRQAREAAARQEEARKAAEEQAAKERQQKYDEWKEQKNQERQVQEAASMAASASILYMVGGIIYDGMDTYNPDFSYQAPAPADKYKPLFYAGVEVGYSGSYFPMLFGSHYSTMVNGTDVEEKSIIAKDVITVNLNVTGKVGFEAENYGAHAYFAPQAGFSPIFDAYQLAPIVGGVRAYAGLKWVKGYMDYRTGSRNVYTYSLDAEELGEGNYDNTFNRMEYGIRFTTNPDTDYRRNHISLGLITETYTAEGIGRFLDPTYNSLLSGKTPGIKGYAFQWKKDHMFNLYANVFTEYLYGGDVTYDSGPLDIDSSANTGVFVEIGFIRTFDFFSPRN